MKPFIGAVELAGPFKILARQIWIKDENRKPPVTGDAIVPKAVQASGSDTGVDASNLINRSGLRDRDADNLDEHSADAATMWRSARGATDCWVEFDLGDVHPLGAICIWNHNDAWFMDRGIRKADISVWTQETGWRKVQDDMAVEQAQGSDDYDTPTLVKLDGVKARKIRFDDLAGFGDPDHVGLSEVQFFLPLGPQAARPDPVDGATDVSASAATLQWTAGSNAVAHDLYLGADPQKLELLGKVNGTSAELSTLAPDTTYCWRIDEVQADGAVVSGPVWRFTTGGLMAWWKLDESQGDQAADASGHKHRARVFGDALWRPAAGKLDGAMEFDGQNDRVEDVSAGDYLNGLSAVTVTLWIKSDVQDEDRDIFFTRDPAGDDNRLGLRYDKEGIFGGARRCIKACVGTTSGETQMESTSDAQSTEWQHLSVVWQHGSSVKLYIDGVCNQPTQDSGPATGTITGVEKFVLGRGSKGMYWDGLIDDVRIYGYALTAEQIRAIVAGEAPAVTATRVTLKTPPVEKPVEKKLVAWWKLDETDGRDVSDSAGGAGGVLVGNPQWRPAGGKVGGALEFDGSGDYVEIAAGPALNLVDQITVAAWIKVRRFSGSFRTVVAKGDTTWRISGDAAGSVMIFAVGHDSRLHVAPGGPLAGDGQWHHVVGVHDGRAVSLYIDGRLDGSESTTDKIPTSSQPITIGENAGFRGRYWNGLVDDVRIYNYALTPDQIAALYDGREPAVETAAAASESANQVGCQPQAGPAGPIAASQALAQTSDTPQPATHRSVNLVVVVLVLAAAGAAVSVSAFGKPRAR